MREKSIGAMAPKGHYGHPSLVAVKIASNICDFTRDSKSYGPYVISYLVNIGRFNLTIHIILGSAVSLFGQASESQIILHVSCSCLSSNSWLKLELQLNSKWRIQTRRRSTYKKYVKGYISKLNYIRFITRREWLLNSCHTHEF